jgi:sugar/nucleoside kinase (ribokinase family)
LRKQYIIDKRKACLALISRIDVLLASSAEVAYLLGPMEPAKAARQLAALGPAVVAIDVGAQNHLVYERKGDHMFSQPAYPVAPVDPTGGADAFGAAFMACLLQTGATVRWAAAAAAVAASFAVSEPGADGALATGPLDAARRLALFVRPGRK